MADFYWSGKTSGEWCLAANWLDAATGVEALSYPGELSAADTVLFDDGYLALDEDEIVIGVPLASCSVPAHVALLTASSMSGAVCGVDGVTADEVVATEAAAFTGGTYARVVGGLVVLTISGGTWGECELASPVISGGTFAWMKANAQPVINAAATITLCDVNYEGSVLDGLDVLTIGTLRIFGSNNIFNGLNVTGEILQYAAVAERWAGTVTWVPFQHMRPGCVTLDQLGPVAGSKYLAAHSVRVIG